MAKKPFWRKKNAAAEIRHGEKTAVAEKKLYNSYRDLRWVRGSPSTEERPYFSNQRGF